ncbi:hypothetical protein [Longivirga aurantiaca]|uniref:Sortase n=1 Tax=Longivirga aurantiaca TaxID=1837743 RepID=A0ABW1T4S6_9ACTN
MSRRHTFASTFAVGAVAGASVLLAAPASANPQATAAYGTFTCSDGRTFDIFGMDVPRFPSQVGFLGGKGAVARWIASEETVTVTVLDGVHANEVIAVDNDYAGAANKGARAPQPDLLRLATCSTSESYNYEDVLTAETAGYVGLDASYVGATVNFTGSATRTVWVNPVQLSKR